MALLERQTQLLRKYHPKAQMWVSPQSFSREWLDEFIEILRKGPAWLDGVVYGPQVRVDLAELRKLVPARYPIRNYPDITHSRHCQFPVPGWDLAYAITEGREVINPRPTQMTRIFELQQPHTMGFLTYSEGVNDDVNKAVWSALGWNPETRPEATLREFARYFFGPRHAGDLAQALLGLERNWSGPLLANQGVESLLQRVRAIEQTAPPALLANWRFQQILYRAYYDAHVRRRLIAERAAEQQAYEALERAAETGAGAALDAAARALAAPPASQDLRARLGELAEAMFQSIRAQLSVSRYRAIATERGANLDTSGMPLNNRIWLTARFTVIRQLATEPERLREIRALVNRASPGPGGYYDDLGDPSNQPHVVPGPGFQDDPEFRRSRLISFGLRGTGAAFGGRNYLDYPMQWWRHAEALHDLELTLDYPDLDPAAAYRLRVVYTGDRTEPRVRAVANGTVEIHPLMARPVPFAPLEFDIPPAATTSGRLRLTFHREKGLGDAGRGMAVSEVWLLRK